MSKKYLFTFLILVTLIGCNNNTTEDETTLIQSTTQIHFEKNTAADTTTTIEAVTTEKSTTVAKSITFDLEAVTYCTITNGTNGNSIQLEGDDLKDIINFFEGKEWDLKISRPASIGWSYCIKFYSNDSSNPIYVINDISEENIKISNDKIDYYYTHDNYKCNIQWYDSLTSDNYGD